jgi:plastocyanin
MRAPTLVTLLSACLAAGSLGCEPGTYLPTGPDDPGETGDDGNPDDGDDGIPGDDDDGTPAPTPNYTITLDAISAAMVLGERKDFLVTVTSENAFAGPVALTTTALPVGWTATFDPATVTVPANGLITSKLTLAIATDATAAAAEWSVQGAGSAGNKTIAVDVEVKPELVIRIPAGALNNAAMSFGGSVKTRRFGTGTKVTWINGDNIDHRIHGNGTGGLNHQANNLVPGASYSVTMTAIGTFNYNCHIHGAMTGQLVIEEALVAP